MHWTLHHCITRDDHHDDGSGGDGDVDDDLMLPTHIWSDGLPNALHPVAWNKNNFTNSSRVLSAIIAYHVSNLCSKMEQEHHLVLILKSFLQNAPQSSPSAVGWQVSDPPALSTTFSFIGLPFAVHQSKRSSPTFRGLRCHHSHHIFTIILISIWKVSDSGTLRPLWVHLIQIPVMSCQHLQLKHNYDHEDDDDETNILWWKLLFLQILFCKQTNKETVNCCFGQSKLETWIRHSAH